MPGTFKFSLIEPPSNGDDWYRVRNLAAQQKGILAPGAKAKVESRAAHSIVLLLDPHLRVDWRLGLGEAIGLVIRGIVGSSSYSICPREIRNRNHPRTICPLA
jgi:hypothetical protein